MSVEVKDSTGRTVSRSRNLAGVIRYARRSPVTGIDCRDVEGQPGQYAVRFSYADGCTAATIWNDWRVLVDWIQDRRSWGPIALAGLPCWTQAVRVRMSGRDDWQRAAMADLLQSAIDAGGPRNPWCDDRIKAASLHLNAWAGGPLGGDGWKRFRTSDKSGAPIA